MLTQLLLLFGGVLLALALCHRLLRRLPLTAAVVYLLAGWLAGLGLGAPPVDLWTRHASLLALGTELALLMSLFAVGLRLRVLPQLHPWKLALLMAGPGVVLAMLLGGVAGVYQLGMPWPAALLLACILAPTDPVLASEVQVRSESDRDALRLALTAEGALNDSTVSPAVMLALGLLGLHALGVGGPLGSVRWWLEDLLWPMAGGALLGLGLGTLLGRLLRRRWLQGELLLRDELLYAGTVALACGLARLTFTSTFLVVFCTGLVLLQALRGETSGDAGFSLPERFHAFGSRMERLVEAVSVLALGLALHSVRLTAWTMAFALVLVLVVRPLSVLPLLREKELLPGQRRLLAWFGIRGLGSLFYLSLALEKGLAGPVAETLIAATLLSVALSILLHGVSVTPMMTAYRQRRGPGPRQPVPAEEASAGTPATQQVDDGQQDDGTQQRDRQRPDAEDALVDRRNAQDGRDEDAGDGGAHDAHDDVEQEALLPVRTHQQAGDPADQTAHHEQHDEIDHEMPSYTARRGQAAVSGNPRAIGRDRRQGRRP